MPYLEQLLKERYEFELRRKEEILSGLSFPITILPLLGGVLFYYFQRPLVLELTLLVKVFFVFGILFILALLFTVYYIGRVFFQHKYGYVVDPNDLYKFNQDYKEYYAGVVGGDIKTEVQLSELMTEEYRKFGQLNAETNFRRSGFLWRCRLVSFASVVLVIPTFICYFALIKPDVNYSERISIGIENLTKEVRNAKSETPKPCPQTPADSTTGKANGKNSH